MTCSACQAPVKAGALHCPRCGAKIASDPASGTAPLAASADQPTSGTAPLPSSAKPPPSGTAPLAEALKAASAAQSASGTAPLSGALKEAAGNENPPAGGPAGRRPWGPFGAGVVVGLLGVPLLLLALLAIFGGTNALRQARPAAPGTPDIRVAISRTYLERSISDKTELANPVVTLGPHPDGGAELLLVVGVKFPIVGVQDVQTRSQLIAQDGKLVVTTERVALGETGLIPVPGNIVEAKISEMVTTEIEKRVAANPAIEIQITAVSASADVLTIDAALTNKPKR